MISNENILSIKNVSKVLSRKEILKNINLEVKRGQVIGIVGKNGSGKTTLLKLIMGLIYPSNGEIIIEGKKLVPGFLGNLPTSIGALIESPTFLPQFSGFHNLHMLASIRNKISKETIMNTMSEVGLEPKETKPVSKYSLGMKQRLGIAQAVMENPKIILFDEPTNALDDDGIEIFSKIVKNMIKKETCFIIVSHKKEDINRLCNRVYEMKDGKLNTLNEHQNKEWKVVLEELSDLENILQLNSNTRVISRINAKPSVIYEGGFRTSLELLQYLKKNNINVASIKDSEKC